jgi:hypothetical protein
MKKYTITVVVNEGSDEFWEELEEANKTGCDEVVQMVKDALNDHFIEAEVSLTRFDDDSPPQT